MERTKVQSEQLASIGYDPTSQTLEIEFKGRKEGVPGKVYSYEGFTAADWEAFNSAESKGKHFGKHIRTKGYVYREIKPEEPKDAESSEKDSPNTQAGA
jgi:KTSC domain-containing protein